MRVDFYEISGRFTDALFVACVLVGRAWPKARTIAIVAARADLEQLDQRLWSEPQGRFLPHGMGQSQAPIQLAEAAPEQAEVLINLKPAAALPDGRFGRVLELVPANETARDLLRKRWLAWKQRGADMHHHLLK